jgi:hypothetical protein
MIPFISKSASYMSLWPIRSRFFLCFLVFFSSLFSTFARLQDVHSLEKDWLIYQAKWKTFLPYIPNKHFNYHSKSILISRNDFYPNSYLKVRPKTSYYLFLNGAFHLELKKDSVYVFSIDSLITANNNSPNLVVTFFNDNLNGLPTEVSIQRELGARHAAKMGNFMSLERITRLKSTFISISLILILILLAVLQNVFPKYFYSYYRYSDWIEWGSKHFVIPNTPFSFPNLFVIVILSLLTSFVGFCNLISDADFLISQGNDLKFWTTSWFVISRAFLAMFLFSSRYFIYQLFTSLFKIEFLTKFHFFKSIQTNLQFISLLYISLVLSTLYFGPSFVPNFRWFSILVYSYFFIRMFYFFRIFKSKFNINSITLGAYLVFIEGQVLLFGLYQILFPNLD